MTTTVDGDDAILTTEVEPDRPLLDARTARVWFLVLAGVAALALLAVIFVVALAPTATPVLLFAALGVLVVVVVAEIVLLLLARPRKA